MIIQIIILALLISIISVFAISGNLWLLVTPRFSFLVIVAGVILFVFLVYLLFTVFQRKQKKEKAKVCLYQPLFLAICAVFIIVLASGNSLNYAAAISKLKGFNPVVISPGASTNISENLPRIKTDNPPGAADWQDSNGQNDTDGQAGSENSVQTIITETIPETIPETRATHSDVLTLNSANYMKYLDDIHTNVDQFAGTEIKVDGFVFTPKGFKPGYFVIGRLSMFCCAADAVVVGFICDKDDSEAEFREDAWYELICVVRSEMLEIRSERSHMPVFAVKEARQIAEPDNPYVYPYF